jgi:hypothetical protein
VVCSSSTSPIYHPYTNAVTWGYAVFFWDDHFMGSGPPKNELLQALKKFDVFRFYVGTLGPRQMHEGFWNTIKRVASPRVCKIAKKLQVFYLIYLYNGTEFCLPFRRFKKQNIDKKGPDPADIEAASQFLIRMGAGIGFTESFYGMVLDNIVEWIKVRVKYHHSKESDTKQLDETEAS